MGDSNNALFPAEQLLVGAVNRISQDVDLRTLRINYRFGGPGAVVARY
jgi:outer membrane immunogenic protein